MALFNKMTDEEKRAKERDTLPRCKRAPKTRSEPRVQARRN